MLVSGYAMSISLICIITTDDLKKKKSVDINGANFHERFILISTKTVLYDEMREHMLF